jgi:GTP cyclohydrolase I
MTVEQLKKSANRPDRKEAEKAVETLLRYIGEDPSREGLLETPARYVRAFDEFFSGYGDNPADELRKTFEDIQGYDDMVVVRDIDFISHCEHHIATITGKAHVAYWPDEKVVGISKLARVVDILAKRLTSQENMTKAIADVITETLAPKGVAVMVRADHQCMSTRGVNKMGASTVTTTFTGCFADDAQVRAQFMELIRD